MCSRFGQVAQLLGARAELRMSCAFRTGKFGKNVCGNVMSKWACGNSKDGCDMRMEKPRNVTVHALCTEKCATSACMYTSRYHMCTKPSKISAKKKLRLHHPVSILIFPTSTCSTGWLSINHNKWRLLGFPRHALLLIFDDAFVWTLSNCVRSMLAIRASLRSSRQLLLLEKICGFCPASLFMQIMARVVSFSLFRRGIARNTQLFWKRSRIDVFISFLLIFLMN